jgi:hypothetical protein
MPLILADEGNSGKYHAEEGDTQRPYINLLRDLGLHTWLIVVV